VIDGAGVGADDVFVDLGSGVGRALAFVHLLTGAAVVGVEIQPELLRAARARMARLGIARATFVEGDAARLTGGAEAGTVFFLYCPFGGERLARALGELERVARERTIRVCAVDLPLPELAWLERVEATPAGDVTVYRSRAPA
jgi:ubiquinone/menaquinone biosynthesis C-methylase UbiE